MLIKNCWLLLVPGVVLRILTCIRALQPIDVVHCVVVAITSLEHELLERIPVEFANLENTPVLVELDCRLLKLYVQPINYFV